MKTKIKTLFIFSLICCIFMTGCNDLGGYNSNEMARVTLSVNDGNRAIAPSNVNWSEVKKIIFTVDGEENKNWVSDEEGEDARNAYEKMTSDAEIFIESGTHNFGIALLSGLTQTDSEKDDITVATGSITDEVIQKYRVNNLSFTTQKKTDGYGSYSVKLTYNDYEKVSKVKVRLEDLEGNIVNGADAASAGYAADGTYVTENPYYLSCPVNKTEYYVSYGDSVIPAGTYFINFIFYSDDECAEKLYNFREMIVIESGRKTTEVLQLENLNTVFTITYNLCGGSWKIAAPTKTTRIKTETTYLPGSSDVQYGVDSFAGWYTNSEYDGDPLTRINGGTAGDITLYAKWNHNHVYSDDWTYDETHHWHVATCSCEDAGISGKEEHDFQWDWRDERNKDATCLETGIEVHKCTSCSADKLITLEATGHLQEFYFALGYDENYHWVPKNDYCTHENVETKEPHTFGSYTIDYKNYTVTFSCTESKCNYSKSYNMLKTGSGWFNSTTAGINKDDVTKVTFQEAAYEGEFSKSWNADNADKGNITAYLVNDTEVIVSGNGKKFYAYNNGSIFYGFSAVTEIDFSGLDTTLCTSMASMFNDCFSLTKITFGSYFNTSNVMFMQYMFSGCNNLVSLNVSSFDTSKVKSMEGMFKYTYALKSLDLSNFDTSSCTNFSHMFGCGNSSLPSALTSLNISSFDTSKATNMEFMFSGLDKIAELDVSSFNTENVTNMQYMFNEMKNLTSLDVSNFDVSNVTTMASMFQHCAKLETLTFGDNFNSEKVTSMRYMFSDCKALSSLDLSGVNTSSVTDMMYMFSYCTNLAALNLSYFNTEKVETMEYMFTYCTNIKSINMSGWNTGNVTNMSRMFNECNEITSLDLSSFDTANVTNMSYMFAFSHKLETIYVSSGFVTSALTSSSSVVSMFYQCEKLTGANGFKYDSAKTNSTYAVVDTDETPGYFTLKSN